jgi:hypothetical protein
MARRPATGWGHLAPRWGQTFPGWDPLPDAGSLPFRAARSLGRWWWPISAIVGFLVVVGYVLGHDGPGPGLSNRGWLTVVLAAVVVATLSVRRTRGIGRAPLARAVAEYAVVALLAALLVTAGAGPRAAQAPEAAAGARPSTEQPAQRRQPAGPDRRQPADRNRDQAERADAGTAADRRPGIVRVVSGVWGWLAELWHTAGELADRRSSATSTLTPTSSARALPAPALAPPIWRSQP